MSKKTVLLTTLALPLALGVQTASAALITEWGYNVENSFSDVTGSGTTGPAISGSGTNQLTWGSGPQSSISITANVSATSGLVTNGDAVDGGVFEHINNPIPLSDIALSTFNLNSVLTLNSFLPSAGTQVGPNQITFSSFFTETPNRAGQCDTDSVSVCDDIFSLSNSDIGQFNQQGNFELVGESFQIEDYSYTVFLEIAGLGVLSDNQCSLADAAPGCIGFTTLENNENTFQSSFRIEATAIPVPEPGSLALLGLGLVGISLARYNRKA